MVSDARWRGVGGELEESWTLVEATSHCLTSVDAGQEAEHAPDDLGGGQDAAVSQPSATSGGFRCAGPEPPSPPSR